MIGDILREELALYNLSQAEFSRIIGVTTKAVNRWIFNKSRPKGETLIKICKFFGWSMD